MDKIEGIEVHNHKDSSRILNIQLDDEIVKKLQLPKLISKLLISLIGFFYL